MASIKLKFRTSSVQGIIGYTLELNEKLRRIGKKRMAARYTTTINSLQRCLKGGDVPLEEIDGTMIQGYEQWLKDSGLCRNTTSFYLRNLRTIDHLRGTPLMGKHSQEQECSRFCYQRSVGA